MREHRNDSSREMDRVESWLGAYLAPDHREFLQLVLPHGTGWPDWRFLEPRSSYDWMADAPVYGHRYLPAGPVLAGHPVLSVHQTDVIYYGADLADYLSLEFGQGHSRERLMTAEATAPFWKDLC